MRRLIYFFIFVGLIHVFYGINISSWRVQIFDVDRIAPATGKFFDYAGVINVHTKKSSGSGDYNSVISAAHTAGLSYIVFTDLNDFSLNLTREGYQDNVLVIVGGEYSYLDSRVLNFDFTSTEHLQSPGRAQTTFADILSTANPQRKEGLFYLAHPLKPGYQLQEPYPIGLDGIEILNLKSIWQEAWTNSRGAFLWASIIYPFNSTLSYTRLLARTSGREIALWDRLNKQHPTYAIFGSDADARFRLPNDTYLEYPAYSTLFSIVKNHVLIKSELTGNAIQDRKKISDALRNGQFYMSADILADPTGFESYLTFSDGRVFPIGAKTQYQPGAELSVKLPAKPLIEFETLVYKDGERVLTSTSVSTTMTLHQPGVYRSVVRVKIPFPFPDKSLWTNWIVTNPIFVQ